MLTLSVPRQVQVLSCGLHFPCSLIALILAAVFWGDSLCRVFQMSKPSGSLSSMPGKLTRRGSSDAATEMESLGARPSHSHHTLVSDLPDHSNSHGENTVKEGACRRGGAGCPLPSPLLAPLPFLLYMFPYIFWRLALFAFYLLVTYLLALLACVYQTLHPRHQSLCR